MSKDHIKQIDLFVGDIIDVAPKGDLHTMEFPIFALSSKKDTDEIRYEFGNGNWVELIPSVKGRPTILDKDILLYCIGQIAEALNRGKPTTRRVSITAYDFLVSTGRETGGKEYKQIEEACVRLKGLVISSNHGAYGLIDEGGFHRDKTGKLMRLELQISEYLYNEYIMNNRILTYSKDYFELSSPYDRRMYEICRKHCGNQNAWEIGLETLFAKFGVRSELKEFRRKMKELVRENKVPDYFLEYKTAKETGTVEKIIVYKKI
jgi:plasmid replication initiation protein